MCSEIRSAEISQDRQPATCFTCDLRLLDMALSGQACSGGTSRSGARDTSAYVEDRLVSDLDGSRFLAPTSCTAASEQGAPNLLILLPTRRGRAADSASARHGDLAGGAAATLRADWAQAGNGQKFEKYPGTPLQGFEKPRKIGLVRRVCEGCPGGAGQPKYAAQIASAGLRWRSVENVESATGVQAATVEVHVMGDPGRAGARLSEAARLTSVRALCQARLQATGDQILLHLEESRPPDLTGSAASAERRPRSPQLSLRPQRRPA